MQTSLELTYTPSSLLHFSGNTSVNVSLDVPIKVEGIYIAGEEISTGVYRDLLKDETNDNCVLLNMPGLLRSKLASRQFIQLSGYLKENAQQDKAEWQLQVVEILHAQVKTPDVPKADADYQSIDGFIMSKIANEEIITVNILVGKNGTIENSLKEQLQEGMQYLKFYFIRVNLSSVKEIIENIKYYQKKCHILAIAALSEDRLLVLDDPAIVEATISIPGFFVTALEVHENVPLIQKVADRSFSSSRELAHYFTDINKETAAQLQKSKASFVEGMSKQFDVTYGKQIKNLQLALTNQAETNERNLDVIQQQLQASLDENVTLNIQIQDLVEQSKKAKKVRLYWTLLFITLALLIGIVVGFFSYSIV